MIKNIFIFFIGSLFFLKSFALVEKDGKFVLESLNDFNQCQEITTDGSACLHALDFWLEKNPNDFFQAAKMVRKKMNHQDAVIYFVKSVKVNSKECQDKDLRLSFLAAINLNRAHNSNTVDLALKLGLDLCANDLAEDVSGLKQKKYARENICKYTQNKNEICR